MDEIISTLKTLSDITSVVLLLLLIISRWRDDLKKYELPALRGVLISLSVGGIASLIPTARCEDSVACMASRYATHARKQCLQYMARSPVASIGDLGVNPVLFKVEWTHATSRDEITYFWDDATFKGSSGKEDAVFSCQYRHADDSVTGAHVSPYAAIRSGQDRPRSSRER